MHASYPVIGRHRATEPNRLGDCHWMGWYSVWGTYLASFSLLRIIWRRDAEPQQGSFARIENINEGIWKLSLIVHNYVTNPWTQFVVAELLGPKGCLTCYFLSVITPFWRGILIGFFQTIQSTSVLISMCNEIMWNHIPSPVKSRKNKKWQILLRPNNSAKRNS